MHSKSAATRWYRPAEHVRRMLYFACYGASWAFNTVAGPLEWLTSTEPWRNLAEREDVSTTNVERQRCYYQLRFLKVDHVDTNVRATHRGLTYILPATIEVIYEPGLDGAPGVVRLFRNARSITQPSVTVLSESIRVWSTGAAELDAHRLDEKGRYEPWQAYTLADEDLTRLVTRLTGALIREDELQRELTA